MGKFDPNVRRFFRFKKAVEFGEEAVFSFTHVCCYLGCFHTFLSGLDLVWSWSGPKSPVALVRLGGSDFWIDRKSIKFKIIEMSEERRRGRT